MTEIDRLSGLMEVLRRQIADSAQRLDAKGNSASPDKSATVSPSIAGKQPLSEIKRRIRERINALPKNDPERAKKAQRLFIESIIAWEFGDALLMDNRFEDMLDRIQQGLNSLPDVSQQLEKMLDGFEKN